MLLTAKDSILENDSVFFDGNQNTIRFKKHEVVIALTELQSRLVFILLSGVTRKRDVIKMVWQDNHVTITDNNYHQLLYQCRSLFHRHGVPSLVIKTIPRHGVKFNYSILSDYSNVVEKLSLKEIPCEEKIYQGRGFDLMVNDCLDKNKIMATIRKKSIYWAMFFCVMSTVAIFHIMN